MTGAGPKLSILSFNIRNMKSRDAQNSWDNRVASVTRLIRSSDPDILGTQEGYMPQVDDLKSQLPEYQCVATGRDDGLVEGETCAVFFKKAKFKLLNSGTFWFSDTPDVAGSRQWNPNHARICTWCVLQLQGTEKVICVYNVHLDHETQSAREMSVEMVLKAASNSDSPNHTIVMGDFNLEPTNAAYFEIINSTIIPLWDCYDECHPSLPRYEDGTYREFTGRTNMGRIDYIFTGLNFNIISAEIIRITEKGKYPSDHFPLLAKLQLR